MKLNQIIDVLTFPITVNVASENYSETLTSKEILEVKFNNYTVKEITTDPVTHRVALELYKAPSLEELGFSFEAGM